MKNLQALYPKSKTALCSDPQGLDQLKFEPL